MRCLLVKVNTILATIQFFSSCYSFNFQLPVIDERRVFNVGPMPEPVDKRDIVAQRLMDLANRVDELIANDPPSLAPGDLDIMSEEEESAARHAKEYLQNVERAPRLIWEPARSENGCLTNCLRRRSLEASGFEYPTPISSDSAQSRPHSRACRSPTAGSWGTTTFSASSQ